MVGLLLSSLLWVLMLSDYLVEFLRHQAVPGTRQRYVLTTIARPLPYVLALMWTIRAIADYANGNTLLAVISLAAGIGSLILAAFRQYDDDFWSDAKKKLKALRRRLAIGSGRTVLGPV